MSPCFLVLVVVTLSATSCVCQDFALSQAETSFDLYYPENSTPDEAFNGYDVAGTNTFGPLNNVITQWNLAAAQACRLSGYDAPRLLSLMHLAQLLAVESTSNSTVAEPAAGFAAHFVLAQLLPQYLNDYDSLLADQLRTVDLEDARQGAALGEGLATSLLQERTNDGTQRFVQVLIQPAGGPAGAYQYAPNQTFPRNMNKANATSFLIPVDTLGEELNTTQLAPNPVGSPEYNADFNFTATKGSSNSTRTPDELRIARQWYDEASGTGGISVHWNQIALAAIPEDASLEFAARLFAMLNTALFDGRIAYFTIKYRELTWRPITAIRAGDSVNAAIPGWTPSYPTVPEPEFPSGHSTLSGVAAAVLTRLFETDDVAFEIGGEGPLANGADPVSPINFTSFTSVVKEVSLGRQLEGVHFSRATTVGELVGDQVGNYVVDNFDSLLDTLSALSPSLQQPNPSISQPIYNEDVSQLMAGMYGAASA